MTNKTIVITSIAILMLMPASVMAQMTPGEEEFNDEVGAVGNTDTYIDLLKLQPSYQNMTSTEQETYIQNTNEFITAQSAYELARNKLLIETSQITIQIKLTNDEQQLQELKTQYENILSQLEEFGVGPQDKTFEDSGYYFDKYHESLKHFEAQGHPVSITDVHTDDISLSNQAGILFPCVPGAFNVPVRCPIGTLTYGPGTSHVEVWFVPVDGDMFLESKVCLTNTIQHGSVYFDISAVENIYNLYGRELYHNEESVDTFLDGTLHGSLLYDCKVIGNTESVKSSDRADLDSVLGSHVYVLDSHV